MGFQRGFRSLFSRKKVELELDEELRYHLERQIDENLAAGMPAAEARYAAFRMLAGFEQKKRGVPRYAWIERDRQPEAVLSIRDSSIAQE